MSNKKAQGMPMNVIIIAIIVLVVLVILIAFFAGGFSSVVNKVRDLFGSQTSGQTRDIAIQTCQTLCDTAITLPSDSQSNSGFCTQTYVVDHDSNPETKPVRMSCTPITITQTDEDLRRGIEPGGDLTVGCPSVKC